ncbi:MAG: DUF2721 domain-containing protein, partial [Burkholderiaceae bacterium]
MLTADSINPLTEAIQLAVAPVFLLTGVAGMLNALGTRLARVIDRARQLQNRLEDDQLALAPAKQAAISAELKTLRQRSKI